MSQQEFEAALRDVTLGGFRFFDTIGSTNDEALAWAASDAADFSLVMADAQTSGRGRAGRAWHSPPGAGLAFSLVLRPTAEERERFGRFSGLGALALVEALGRRGLAAGVKWPNDVLIRRRKVAGILVEAVWTGAEVDSLVLGMGVNVSPEAAPPESQLTFPATSLKGELGKAVQRPALLRDILLSLSGLRKKMLSEEFLQEWQAALVFRGEQVQIWQRQAPAFSAELVGLEGDGNLVVKMEDGGMRSIHFGEVHLRPAS